MHRLCRLGCRAIAKLEDESVLRATPWHDDFAFLCHRSTSAAHSKGQVERLDHQAGGIVDLPFEGGEDLRSHEALLLAPPERPR